MSAIGSGIVQEGHRNPIDIMIDALGEELTHHKIPNPVILDSFTSGIVEHCLTWAFGEDWMSQKPKDFPDRWNDRHGNLYRMRGKISQLILFGRNRIDPERELRIVAKHYVLLYLREAWAIQKGAKFGKDCPCGTRRKFEKCCGEIAEKHLVEAPTTRKQSKKSILTNGIMNLSKPSQWQKDGLGWFKGKPKKEEPTNGDSA